MVSLLHVFLLAVNLLGALAASKNTSTACLPRFRTEPDYFRQCKTNVCFLFVNDPPFIMLDPKMVAENNQTVFRCRDRGLHFPDLKGIIFYVKDAIVPLHDALCVYGGNQCTFNGMIEFISQHSSPQAKHRFGQTGIAFIMPHRIRATSKPTVPIMEGKLVIVGPRSAPKKNDSLTRMILPFELGAWLSILVVSICLMLLWVLVALAFMRKLSIRSFLRLIAGEDEPEMSPPSEQPGSLPEWPNLQENLGLLRKIAIAVLRSSFKVFLATTIIFYEVLIAYHIFEQRAQTATIDVQGLNKADLSEYIVAGGGAQEFVLRKNVDPRGTYDNGTVPWNRCNNYEDCFQKLLDKTHRAKFMVTHDFEVRYHLHKMNACNRLAVYDTKRPLLAFSGVWYLNSNVPGDVRDAVDRSITTLRLEDNMRAILSRAVDDRTPLHCGKQSPRIAGGFLGPLFAFVLGPLVIIVVVMLVWGCVIQTTGRRNRAGLKS